MAVGELARSRYISLTTFRRDGSAASTPVWVVSDDGSRLLVWTAASSWKVRRIRRDPRVLVASSDFRGRELGPRIAGTATLLGDADGRLIQSLLRRKYGWQRRILELQARIARVLARAPAAAPAYIEITG